MLFRIFSLLVCLCLLTACAVPAAAPTATPLPSATLPPTAAPTGTATAIPTFTPTLTPTVPPAAATLTPQPVLSPDEAKQAVLDLLVDNGGCQLPCLWGFSPGGEGSTKEIISFYRRLPLLKENNANPYINYDRGYLSMIYSVNNIRARMTLAPYRDHLNFYALADDATTHTSFYGDPDFNQAISYYLLPQILTTYGRPSQVLLMPFTDSPETIVIVFYPEQHFLVEYTSPTEKVGTSYVWYPNRVHLDILVWPSDQSYALQDVVEAWMTDSHGADEGILPYFKPIEESTSMTIDGFYQKCKDPQDTPCLETPVEKWKELEQIWPDWNK